MAAFLATSAALASPELSDAQYVDKVRGAWTAKCVGGALGMPLESWRSGDIEKRYPEITGYLGYFSNVSRGWSGFVGETEIPKDGTWRTVSARLTVPNTGKGVIAVPIIGLSLEKYKNPQEYELKNIRVLRPANSIPHQPTDWQAQSECAWTMEGTIRAKYTGERSWLKMTQGNAKTMRLTAGDTCVIAMEARWLSGDNRLGFAFDYVLDEPLKGFGPDDDTSYQIVGLLALEKFGPDLGCVQIGEEWVNLLPEIHPSLAEGIALQRMRKGTKPPESGVHPVGEAIGGQMKGEIWGLVCPGRPDLAAEYARRDGVVAHQKNGVYGEQFVAAMMAQAFVETDVHRLVETGLRYVPAGSEYATVVKSVIADHEARKPWKDVLKALVTKYPGICDPVFAEAGIVTLALLYGDGDYEKTLTLAARCGNDTDCNAATVSALLGCVQGLKALPAKWTGPIGDDFRCFVKGYEDWKISEIARRVAAVGRKVQKRHGESTRFTAPL